MIQKSEPTMSRISKSSFKTSKINNNESVQQKWNEAVSTLTKTAEEIIGMKNTVNNNNNRTHDDEIDKMSNAQKKLRLLISSCIDVEKVQNMRTDRNILLKEIEKKTLENREVEIDKMVREIDKIQDEAKMFKAVKTLSRKNFENPFIHDKDGKHISNPQEIYNTVRDHFKNHFYDEDIQTLPAFIGEPKKLTKAKTINAVTRAIKKLNNNRAAVPDGISAELVKYAPIEVHKFICDILNDVLENHNDLDLGRGCIVALQKPGKPKDQ